VEYVGLPYAEICKHAFLPALLSYISLFYIVHLEALKLDLRPFVRVRDRTRRDTMIAWGLGISGTIVVLSAIYFVAEAVKNLAGAAAPWILGGLLAALYVWSIRVAARCPDLPQDVDVDNPSLPSTWPTVKAGMHFLIPIGVLIWCLMIEELSPALSAFWAVVILIVLMITQTPLITLFRGQKAAVVKELRSGVWQVVEGLNDGARNMIGIAIATGTAGIIVGGITLTGLGLRMTDFVEFVSMGNVVIMLLFTAFVCLVLGLGVPTTANYILVATLMAPVIVELGAQSGLVIPLIGVHLFVFYYGIMGDITPPVGLASFAAAAISGEDPIDTGVQGAVYALRTVILPFVWIFNPALLLIGVNGWFSLAVVVVGSTIACLIFAAATIGWFQTKNRWWETLLLLVAVFMLFRPNFFMDRIYNPYVDRPASEIYQVAQSLPEDSNLIVVLEGTNIEGDDIRKTVSVRLTKPGDGRVRLRDAGLTLSVFGEEVRIGTVRFGSRAKRGGFEQGWKVVAIKTPADTPSDYWVFIPAIAIIALVFFNQRRRASRAPPAGQTVTA
jgi:TRAP transporter 4TM/12TM fusion protein